MRVPALGQDDPLDKETAATAVRLPGKSRGQRSLAGYSPWGGRESHTTEHTRPQTLCAEHLPRVGGG